MSTPTAAPPTPTAPVLGVIADDFTGATDVASMLVRAGLRVLQVIGVPGSGPAPEVDAVVVALKSRTVPAPEAVAESLAALRWLQAGGVQRFYFKYCSTFDSTPAGNIGPVAEALLAALGSDFSIACPAFPENGRSIYRGHLFVGDALLSDTGMREHPLTPMTDANLVRVLQAQTKGRVGLVRHDVVAQGPAAIRARFAALRAEGVRFAVTDALDNTDLVRLAGACADLPLVTAGSGLALGLPAAYAERGWLDAAALAEAQASGRAARLDAVGGRGVVLAGSCSTATLGQVERWKAAGRPALRIDALALAGDGTPAGREQALTVTAGQALSWAADHLSRGADVLIHASAPAAEVRAVQAELGVHAAGALVEQALAHIALALQEGGMRRFVVAGGETSGAVVQALGVQRLVVGASICPGVPWTQAEGRPLLLALKSGNFGGPDFFAEALALTDTDAAAEVVHG
ncbi:MAG: hypothetical protein RIQ60_899 [Pseudomonadota bacterium]|jgi:uncharacterized protein YgbK (DUF1537 family)